MKKFILFLVIVFALQANVNAKEVLILVERQGAKIVVVGENPPYPGFRDVTRTTYDDGNGTTNVVANCKNPGENYCTVVLNGHRVYLTIENKTFDSDIIYDECNKMLNSIDKQIVNGILEGTMSSKIQIYSIDDNKPCIICLEAVWICDKDGNGKIKIYSSILS